MKLFRGRPKVIWTDTTDNPELEQLIKDQKRVGYWCSPEDPFFANFPRPEDCVDANWDPRERRRVIKYLKAGEYGAGYLGSSSCRFNCGIPDEKMGSHDMNDEVYMYPEGYAHYLEKHNVKPPEEFLEHVRKRLAQKPVARFRVALASLIKRIRLLRIGA